MYPGSFTEYTEDLQEGHVLSVYRVWAEVILYETQNFWLCMIHTEAGYLLTVLYVEYFQEFSDLCFSLSFFFWLYICLTL